MSAMGWQESARRSLFCSRLADCKPHVLSWMEPRPGEPMFRLDCSRCNGSAWVNLWPAQAQGADPDEVIEYVEGLISGEPGEKGTKGS